MKKLIETIIILSLGISTSLTPLLKKEEKIIKNSQERFGLYYEFAEEKIENMTLEERIAQILLVRVPATNEIETLKKYQFGGYLLFARDFANLTKEQVQNKINQMQEVSKIPILTAVDEEGGIVVRISNNPNLRASPFLSSKELYNEGGLERIKTDTIEKSNLLSELGINLNLAPVVDIAQNESDYMYKRSLGQNAIITSEYTKTVIESSKGLKVSYTLKHFPGYGNNVDTHTGSSKDERTLENLHEIDLKPFSSGIEAGAEAILISHNIVTALDAKNPASLSKNVHDLLKNDLHFSGVIITDDLDMGATKNIANKNVLAIQSGNDLLITTDYQESINEIKNAIQNHLLTEEELNQKVRKIIAWKYEKGLL